MTNNVVGSYVIVNNPAQVQNFQRDGFLIFLAPDKSYQQHLSDPVH